MPIAPVNAAQAYQDLIVNAGPAIGLKGGSADYSGLFDRVKGTLSARTAAEQFTFDCALWYGYLEKLGGAGWKKAMVKRIFSVMYWGGLMCQRGDNQWVSWASQEAPICSTISHTARILVMLPENDDNEAFWSWLWGDQTPEGRCAATHGIEAVTGQARNIGPLNAAVHKCAKELKKNQNVSHYGVNIALGGNGNTNPVSGKGIRENGKHGHLYLAYHSGTITTRQGPRRALLIGTEQSCPIDRQEGVQGKFGAVKSFFRGVSVPDQYGGGHGLGGHSRFSATGGDDFAYTWKERTGAKSGIFGRKQKEEHTGNLGAYGPAVGYYYDGMYIDLTVRRFTTVMREARGFTSAMVGQAGQPPA